MKYRCVSWPWQITPHTSTPPPPWASFRFRSTPVNLSPKVDIDISSIRMVKVGVDLLYWRGLVSTELVAPSLHMQHQVSVRSRHWCWRRADRPSSLSRLWIVCADTGCLWLAITSSEALVAVNNLSRRCCILIFQFWAGVVTLGWRRWGQFSVLPRSQKASSEADYCRGL